MCSPIRITTPRSMAMPSIINIPTTASTPRAWNIKHKQLKTLALVHCHQICLPYTFFFADFFKDLHTTHVCLSTSFSFWVQYKKEKKNYTQRKKYKHSAWEYVILKKIIYMVDYQVVCVYSTSQACDRSFFSPSTLSSRRGNHKCKRRNDNKKGGKGK